MKKKIYYKYFEENILPVIYQFEDHRLKMLRNMILISAFSLIAGILFAVSFVYIALKHNAFIIMLPIFLFLMYACFIKSIVNIMLTGREYQNWLLQTVLPYFFQPVANFKFWPKNENTEIFISSKILGNFETRDDLTSIFGIYGNTNITMSNTELKIPVNRIVFKGTTIQLEFPKSINNHIIIISKNAKKINRYKQVNPHIDDMNKYLYVFAKNKNNLNIINEDFWRILKRFGELYTAKKLGFSFNNKTVFICLEQKRPWLFGFLFKSLLSAKNYDDLIERFIVIYDLIDYINSLSDLV